jgi:hypothetical protein
MPSTITMSYTRLSRTVAALGGIYGRKGLEGKKKREDRWERKKENVYF